MSRIEAWNFMKKLNDGTASLVVRIRPVRRRNISGRRSAVPSQGEFPNLESPAPCLRHRLALQLRVYERNPQGSSVGHSKGFRCFPVRVCDPARAASEMQVSPQALRSAASTPAGPLRPDPASLWPWLCIALALTSDPPRTLKTL